MKNKTPQKTPDPSSKPVAAPTDEAAFGEIVRLIRASRQRAYQGVNTELIMLYWQVGEYISCKLDTAEWGDGVVDELARYLARTQPGLRGFTRRNLFRMRQFYETYAGCEKVSALLTQLPWTHHFYIIGRSKVPEGDLGDMINDSRQCPAMNTLGPDWQGVAGPPSGRGTCPLPHRGLPPHPLGIGMGCEGLLGRALMGREITNHGHLDKRQSLWNPEGIRAANRELWMETGGLMEERIGGNT